MPMMAAGLSAGASVLGGIMGGNAAKKAAGQQAKSAKIAAMIQKQMYDQTRKDNMPWMDRGNAAGARLNALMGLGGDQSAPGYGQLMQHFDNSKFEQDPGYQWRLQQGQKDLQASAAAHGGLMSGAALKALDRYNQGYASNEYQNAYNRYTNDQGNDYSRLYGISNQGMGAAQGLGNFGQNYANSAGNALMSAGAAKAAGTMGQANAWSGAMGGIGNAWQDYNAMNTLRGVTRSYGG